MAKQFEIGDKVKIINYSYKNCSGINFDGLTGTIIAKIDFRIEWWVVLFDEDVCGLVLDSQPCNHDASKRISHYSCSLGQIALSRNQRCFQNNNLLLLDSKVEKNCEPKNNDGRSTCFWCGAATKQVGGIVNVYNICTKCRR